MKILEYIESLSPHKITHEAEVNSYTLRVLAFNDSLNLYEIMIIDIETGITQISNEKYDCPGVALLSGLEWIKKNV